MMNHCCTDMEQHVATAEIGLVFSEKLREYGLQYRDGGLSFQIIDYCPWCGVRLPSSLRDQYFSILEEMNIDPWGEHVPREFQSSEWWLNRGL